MSVVGISTACDMLGPAEYASREEYADYDDDAPPPAAPSAAEAPSPPPTPVATISEAEWNERFEQAQRTKHDRALELNDAAARCYQKLRDPETGGSTTLAQAICFGGNAPKGSPVPGVVLTRTAVETPPDPVRRFDPTAARASLRSTHLEGCRRGETRSFADADVTFAATGQVAAVTVSLPPDVSSDERACVVRKASEARTPPFEGGTAHVNFAWFR